MAKVKEIIDFIKSIAPEYMQEDWDNSGSQLYFDEDTPGVMLTLDVTDNVIDATIKENYKLILSHHPMIFGGLKSIVEGQYLSDNIIKAIFNRISIYSAHTSLDSAKGGVNDALCEELKLKIMSPLGQGQSGYTMGYICQYEKALSFEEFKNSLKKYKVKIYGRPREIKKVAICGGSGMDFFEEAKTCDAFITGDVKYHDGQKAYENNLTLVDMGHYTSEKFVLEKLKKSLLNEFKNLEVDIAESDFQIK